MKIDLKYILSRNRSTLKDFIDYNKITSYEELLLVCASRGFVPVTRLEFEETMTPVKNEKNEKTNDQKSENKSARKSQPERRSTSSTKRKRRTRASSKNIKDS